MDGGTPEKEKGNGAAQTGDDRQPETAQTTLQHRYGQSEGETEESAYEHRLH